MDVTKVRNVRGYGTGVGLTIGSPVLHTISSKCEHSEHSTLCVNRDRIILGDRCRHELGENRGVEFGQITNLRAGPARNRHGC